MVTMIDRFHCSKVGWWGGGGLRMRLTTMNGWDDLCLQNLGYLLLIYFMTLGFTPGSPEMVANGYQEHCKRGEVFQ